MKTYKTWEMIKELTEHPEKKFESTESGVCLVAINRDGIFKVLDKKEGYLQKAWLLDREWEEVKEPVSFLDVLKTVEFSWIDKSLRITIVNEIYEVHYTNTLKYILDYLTMKFGDHQIAVILLTSDFYIED